LNKPHRAPGGCVPLEAFIPFRCRSLIYDAGLGPILAEELPSSLAKSAQVCDGDPTLARPPTIAQSVNRWIEKVYHLVNRLEFSQTINHSVNLTKVTINQNGNR
jgi:hypothetical protein